MLAVTTAVPSVAPSADGRPSALAGAVLIFAVTPSSVTGWPGTLCFRSARSRSRMSVLGSAPLMAAASVGLADSLMSKSVALVVVPDLVSDRPPEWLIAPDVRAAAIFDLTIGNVATVGTSVAGGADAGAEPGPGNRPGGP